MESGNSEAQKHHTMMRSATMRRLSQGLTPHTMIQMPAHAMLLPLSKGVLLNEQVREDIAVALQHGWKIVLLSIKDEHAELVREKGRLEGQNEAAK